MCIGRGLGDVSRADTMVSTMKAYVDAVRAEATTVIKIGGVEQQVALDELT